MTEFFKPPANPIDAAQIGNLLNNALEGMEPKALKGEQAKKDWRLGIIKSAKGQEIAKRLSTRLSQNGTFVSGKNDEKTAELQAVLKAFTEKAQKDLKKQFDMLSEKSLKDAVTEMKKLAKSA